MKRMAVSKFKTSLPKNGTPGVDTNYAKNSPRIKDAGSSFKQAKVTLANSAKAKGGVSGSGSSKFAPSQYMKETAKRNSDVGVRLGRGGVNIDRDGNNLK